MMKEFGASRTLPTAGPLTELQHCSVEKIEPSRRLAISVASQVCMVEGADGTQASVKYT